MTAPFLSEQFVQAPVNMVPLEPDPIPEAPPLQPFPDAMLRLSDEQKTALAQWLDDWLYNMESSQATKQKQFAEIEEGYRALPEPAKQTPFVGACNDVVPAIAMAVDPIHARLDLGIFKQDPVYRIKALRKAILPFSESVERWVDFYQRHMLKLRQVASPRILECCKLGTMVFKTVYDKEVTKIQKYGDDNKTVITEDDLVFAGPRVLGVSLGDFLFPPNYQHVQDCPIVAERIRTTYWGLKVAEKSGKVTNVNSIKPFAARSRTELESAREDAVQHSESLNRNEDLVIHEVWCDYDINGDDLPERLVIHYHKETRTFLSIRYNWYFHQRKPYTVIPYTISLESLWGIGIGEMTLPFQKSLTKWHQMATDNAYLANIRMFIAKKGGSIEEKPRLYSGRVFYVNDKDDLKPFAAAEIYPSTLSERQNIFGMLEKRTGISDYLTGRESPVIGSRATATSTLALIQEGTKRVEEVLENFRNGFAEIMQYCFSIWIQYGLGDIDELVFGDDKIAQDVKQFFNALSKRNVNGMIGIDLAATDAATNRQVMQQMQLQIIQTMMGYFKEVMAAGQIAMQAQATLPQYSMLVADTMKAARKLFQDLLSKYDIRNPEDYLPALEEYLVQAPAGPPVGGSVTGLPGGPQGSGGVSTPPVAPAGAPGSGAAGPGGPAGGQIARLLEIAGQSAA